MDLFSTHYASLGTQKVDDGDNNKTPSTPINNGFRKRSIVIFNLK